MYMDGSLYGSVDFEQCIKCSVEDPNLSEGIKKWTKIEAFPDAESVISRDCPQYGCHKCSRPKLGSAWVREFVYITTICD